MRLKVLIPSQIFIDEEVIKISTEGKEGAFTMLPHHIDYVSALVPGILIYETTAGEEKFIAINDAILVKKSENVSISTDSAIRGKSLGTLQNEVRERFLEIEESEQEALAAFTRLEADFVRMFMETGE